MSWVKVSDLRKLIGGFGCRMIQNHKGHSNNDDEFYIHRVMKGKSEAELLDEATGYIYYYDNMMKHYALKYQTPFTHIKSQPPEIDDRIRL